ncbi:hypothetical protein [Nodularia spumigena]|uniref:Uncharacterized protein n=1 Tax=Nodularia spumigena UHCC 0060 TaxID=3110300 RepID=A0ABU5UUM9_NODSP|nr:hypothetical protein [Nodularia spumigena]MEA5526944.1 hypothetical protein [Nodularia spumigena UHCC 0143]MEA5609832.1 hypothetical protein [Nodularia spumigena UHCC 0060]MEA5615584.1 hypothetical protein [Nodularia spumigena UHCC 0040]
MSQYTEYHEAHGMPVSVTKYEPEDWELEVQEYEQREKEMKNNLAIALNSTLAAKFQIENLNNPNTPYEVRIELISRFLDSTIKSIREVQGLTDIE